MILKKILNRNRSRYQIPVSFIYHTSYAPAAQRTPTIFPGAAEPIHHNLPEEIYVDSVEICYSIEKADYIHGCCFWSHRKYYPAILIRQEDSLGRVSNNCRDILITFVLLFFYIMLNVLFLICVVRQLASMSFAIKLIIL